MSLIHKMCVFHVYVYAQGIGGAGAAVGALSTQAEDYSNIVRLHTLLPLQLSPISYIGRSGAGVGPESHKVCRDPFQGLVICMCESEVTTTTHS